MNWFLNTIISQSKSRDANELWAWVEDRKDEAEECGLEETRLLLHTLSVAIESAINITDSTDMSAVSNYLKGEE